MLAIRSHRRECSPTNWPSAKWRSPHFLVYAPLFLVLRSLTPSPAPAQDGIAREYREKADFLAAFPKFVEWPDTAFPSATSPIHICVVGDFSFGTSLASQTRSVQVHGRPIEVRWARTAQQLRGCQILFVSRSEAGRYPVVLRAVRGENVLTVGETPHFLEQGGTVEFLFNNDRLQFAVNLSAASDAHLLVSSRMLAMASHIVGQVAVRSQVQQQPN